MPIRVTLDRVLTDRGMSGRDLARLVGITEANLSLLRNGRVKGMRFETLAALCLHLQCQPGDLLRWEAGKESEDAECADGAAVERG